MAKIPKKGSCIRLKDVFEVRPTKLKKVTVILIKMITNITGEWENNLHSLKLSFKNFALTLQCFESLQIR